MDKGAWDIHEILTLLVIFISAKLKNQKNGKIVDTKTHKMNQESWIVPRRLSMTVGWFAISLLAAFYSGDRCLPFVLFVRFLFSLGICTRKTSWINWVKELNYFLPENGVGAVSSISETRDKHYLLKSTSLRLPHNYGLHEWIGRFPLKYLDVM